MFKFDMVKEGSPSNAKGIPIFEPLDYEARHLPTGVAAQVGIEVKGPSNDEGSKYFEKKIPKASFVPTGG